ncbi:murein transglycosylase B, partial [Klebsiella pneumoniae]
MLQGMKARRGGAVEGLFCLQTDCRFLVGRRMLYHNYPLLNLLNGIPMLKRRYLP